MIDTQNKGKLLLHSQKMLYAVTNSKYLLSSRVRNAQRGSPMAASAQVEPSHVTNNVTVAPTVIARGIFGISIPPQIPHLHWHYWSMYNIVLINCTWENMKHMCFSWGCMLPNGQIDQITPFCVSRLHRAAAIISLYSGHFTDEHSWLFIFLQLVHLASTIKAVSDASSDSPRTTRRCVTVTAATNIVINI